jgi:hypothetical protein
MITDLLFYKLLLLALVWLCLMLHMLWPTDAPPFARRLPHLLPRGVTTPKNPNPLPASSINHGVRLVSRRPIPLPSCPAPHRLCSPLRAAASAPLTPRRSSVKTRTARISAGPDVAATYPEKSAKAQSRKSVSMRAYAFFPPASTQFWIVAKGTKTR